jgi:hypothetical protein
MLIERIFHQYIIGFTFSFLLLLILQSSLRAEDQNPWGFRFGLGTLFPDASELVDPNSPNGLNLSASLAYQYQSWWMMQGTLHFDYFSNDKQLDFRSYILLFNFTFESQIHPLSVSSKFSPYLIGGVAPAVYLNTKPYIKEGEELDPFATRRDYDLDAGYTLKYGIGATVYLTGEMRIWAEWQYSRFAFFKNGETLRYRSFLIGLLLDIQWLQ